MNFNCTILDVAPATIPASARRCRCIPPSIRAIRRSGLESGRPLVTGNNVRIGGGATILPGVTIGDDAIVGAGSVASHRVAPGATVAGNPAQVVIN